jgi:hypothetical protein
MQTLGTGTILCETSRKRPGQSPARPVCEMAKILLRAIGNAALHNRLWMQNKRTFAYLLSFGNKPWESLARKLKDEGYHSQYLDRLTRKVSIRDHRFQFRKIIKNLF